MITQHINMFSFFLCLIQWFGLVFNGGKKIFPNEQFLSHYVNELKIRLIKVSVKNN